MSELRNDLAALKIDRGAAPAPRRWPLFLLVPAVLFLGGAYFLRFQDRALEVSTAKVTKSEISADSGGASTPGTPLLLSLIHI